MKIKTKIIFILIIFLNSCGYSPIYYNERGSIKIDKIEMRGDKKINNKIYNNLKNLQGEGVDTKKLQIQLETKKERVITSKNQKGDSKSFNLTINVKLIVSENNILVETKSFQKNYNYNGTSNKFDLSKNEKIIQENLTEKIAEEIILFLYSL
tara:strand:- start:142 stop:600 length:459 start_codon:yes stop_codon:yes gene_type:complete